MTKHKERQVRLVIDEPEFGIGAHTWTVGWIPLDECPKVGEFYTLRDRSWRVDALWAIREVENRA